MAQNRLFIAKNRFSGEQCDSWASYIKWSALRLIWWSFRSTYYNFTSKNSLTVFSLCLLNLKICKFTPVLLHMHVTVILCPYLNPFFLQKSMQNIKCPNLFVVRQEWGLGTADPSHREIILNCQLTGFNFDTITDISRQCKIVYH